MKPLRALRIRTPRLLLRPTEQGDAERAFDIQSNWNVARMLWMAAYPPDRRDIAHWFASHEEEWLEGRAFRFAILKQDRMIGLIDLDEIESGGISAIGSTRPSGGWALPRKLRGPS